MTTAVIEALATGLPVIATIHSGFPDQVHEGKNGYLVPERDYQSLAEKILHLIEHSELWGPFGAYGKKLMLEKYDSKTLMDRQVALYQSLTRAR
jgi:colanic acid/amylovoran biosynthesis glycosyltransferase